MSREVEMQEMDWTSLVQPSEEMRRSWVLQPPTDLSRNTSVKKKKKKCILTVLAVVVLTASFAMTIKTVTHRHHDQQPHDETYSTALRAALKFFNSQRSGHLPHENNVSWRGDSCLQDGSYPYTHLAGGYYDGGDAIKSNFPMSFSMTILSWNVIEYLRKGL